MSDTRPKYCPRCGTEAPAHGNYCPECGADIAAEADSQTSPQAESNEGEDEAEQAQYGAMGRRDVLLAGGVLAVSGIGAGYWYLNGGESGPRYDPDRSQSSMLLPVSDFPSGWEEDSDYNPEFDTAYLNETRSIVVLLDVELHDTVSTARGRYRAVKNSFGQSNNIKIGDQAVWVSRSDNARCLVRDSNAIGIVVGARQSGTELTPDVERAQQYALELVDYWHSL